MPDSQKEWLKRAEIDYFSPFVSLWLAFSVWYQEQYPDIAKHDRDTINNIKKDDMGHSILVKNADARLTGIDKESIEFRENLEQFHYALEASALIYINVKRAEKISFTNALIKYNGRNRRTAYKNLIVDRGVAHAIPLGSVHITHETDIVVAGLIEIIYQIRCQLFHGNLQPVGANREVVKYAYFVLLALIPAKNT